MFRLPAAVRTAYCWRPIALRPATDTSADDYTPENAQAKSGGRELNYPYSKYIRVFIQRRNMDCITAGGGFHSRIRRGALGSPSLHREANFSSPLMVGTPLPPLGARRLQHPSTPLPSLDPLAMKTGAAETKVKSWKQDERVDP